jgi:hypothetical protein
VAVMAGTFILIGVFRFSMVPTVLCLTPLSIAFAYFWPSPPRAPVSSDAGG